MTELYERLQRALAGLNAGHQLDDHTSFFEAGLTSARLAEAVADLRAEGTDVTLVDMFRHPTLGQLADELSRRGGTWQVSDAAARLPWDD